MTEFNRRDALKVGAGAAAAAGMAGTAEAQQGQQAAPTLRITPERGAQLRVLRWRRFVEGDERTWVANTQRFTQQTGIQVRLDNESWEDIRPKAAVAANVGRGPDIIFGWYDDPHQYPDKLVEVTDLANYLGRKYGGWYPVAERYGKNNNKWMSLPLGCAGNAMVYRVSAVREAGFEQFPRDFPGFLRLAQALKRNNKGVGFALGNAVGDANGWCHWVVWGHGAKMVDDQGNVVINSPQTIAALEYAKQLYETFVPGTLSWGDINNNRAFLAGELALTANGISVYYSAKTSTDPAQRAIAEDLNHANLPIGPVGRAAEINLATQAMIFKYTRYPNAAKEYLRFMWEQEQINAWVEASIGYVTPALTAYERHPVWTSDPKVTPYRDSYKNMLWSGYSGPMGYASAASMADYIIVNMVAEAASGARTPQQAAERAAERANRYYRL